MAKRNKSEEQTQVENQVAENASETKGKQKYQELYDSEEAAKTEAESREKGPRKPFKVTSPDGSRTWFVVHHNQYRAAGAAFLDMGATVEEIGAKKRAAPKSADGVMAAVNSLPEAEREKVLEQLKALIGQ